MAEAERVLPHDEAAEMAVIGSVLMFASEAVPLVGELLVDDFYLPHHREAWAAIQAVMARPMPVDAISVGDELKARGSDGRFPGGWHDWWTSAAGSVTVWHNVGSHADVVRSKATLRKLISLAMEVSHAAYGQHPVEDVLSMAREGVAALEVSGCGKGPETLAGLLGATLDAVDARQRGEIPVGVPTGIKGLDRKIGCLKPGRLHILGGRPGDGKTALAKKIALHAAMHGVPTIFFSREMLNHELVERDLSLTSRVPAYDIGGGNLDYSAWKKLQEAAGNLTRAKLWFDDRSATIERIVAETRKWHALHVRRGLGLMVVDYLQLVRLSKVRAGSNREQIVAEISRALKELAGELQIPVLVLSQLNRGAEERGGRPIPSDLRESGAIEQDADVILFVYRDIPPEDQEARRQSGRGEVIVGKHRGGPTGIVLAYFETALMEWADLADEPDPQPELRGHWQDGRSDLE